MRTARVSNVLKPALMQSTTAHLHGVLRGQRGQRDGTELLGTWEDLDGASGVNRRRGRGIESIRCRAAVRGVGEARSSVEAGESRWSEGALAMDTLTQNLQELIGR